MVFVFILAGFKYLIMKNPSLFLLLLLFSLHYGCQKSNSNTLFKLVSSDHSGIDFNNVITENEQFNIIKLEYLYNGGGVGVGDFNQDGLSDIFFSGNMVDNQLYLNQGNLTFKNVSSTAKVEGSDRWKSGIAVVDINTDGKLDIYVCATISADSLKRQNLLFVNQGNNDEGIPIFTEQAESYGINDFGYSSNAAFFDYDNDGDLDLYVIENGKQYGVPVVYKPKVNDGTASNTDKLFRNNGDNTFTDVSDETGIVKEGYGLGISILDINNDGWQDVYVGNDFLTNDILYINEGGHFVDRIDSMIKHQSKFSMGNDVADIDNDGQLDIYTLDMLPEENLRKKTVMGDAGYITYINDMRYGYTHQYSRNMLQLNNGDGTFSEIGQMVGIHETEWSWSPLWADYDNDGDDDLLITNGFPKDITDRDFVNFRTEVGAFATDEFLLDKVPSVKVANYAYRNDGDLKFTKVTKDWGLNYPSFSNGAAFADLDNDGDLDYIVNNIDDKAFLFENTLMDASDKDSQPHYLRIKLEGSLLNPQALGAKVEVIVDDRSQIHYHNIYRGYISTVEDIIHFGLGHSDTIAQIKVIWPDGKLTKSTNVKVDQVVTIKYEEDAEQMVDHQQEEMVTFFHEVDNTTTLNYSQPDYDFIDYNVQRTIPHKFTQNNPAVAVGDVNGDGLEDVAIGAYARDEARIYIQQTNGKFKERRIEKINDKRVDTGLLLFDADNDKDLDLYIASGGFQYSLVNTEVYRDRLYMNDGNGNYTLAEDALPEIFVSSMCVRAEDFDKDGDLDLFVGSRVVPHEYPYAPNSYLLKNENGKFTDATKEWSSNLSNIGMITDGIWTDYDNDGDRDLIVVGEFMPITFFKNNNQKLERDEHSTINDAVGWWNSIAAKDLDHDGDMDYVVGNLGQNNFYHLSDEHPLKVFADDFDENGGIDAILACYLNYNGEEKKLCPVHFWDDLAKQSPRFRKQFSSYARYGMATMDSVLTKEEMATALVLEANYAYSSVIENNGNGSFDIHALPAEVQVSPVKGINFMDVDNNGFEDILLVGNEFGNEVVSGVFDALNGLVLLNSGNFDFIPADQKSTGFYVKGDAKALVKLKYGEDILVLATQNKAPAKLFELNQSNAQGFFTPELNDSYAMITTKDGKVQKEEFYYGSGYLSQSTRILPISDHIEKMIVFDTKGQQRAIDLSDNMIN